MNYLESRDYLNRLGNEVLGMRFGLETTRTLLAALGNPHQRFPAVLVAGTNGKGSVSRFLASILWQAGLSTGLYTSPHLVRPEERFVINGEDVRPELLARSLTRVADAIAGLKLAPHPTYFETLTALAFVYFAESRVDLAVLEVGMGGRLDSTNVVDPLVSIITRIGLDHQRFLGNTLSEIAREKAGIIHPGRPVLSAPQTSEVKAVLTGRATEVAAEYTELDLGRLELLGSTEGFYRYRRGDLTIRPGLRGLHQIENSAMALMAAEKLSALGFRIPPETAASGVAGATLPGRLQKIAQNPAVYLDGGHNIDAASNLVRFLAEHTEEPRSLVLGMMRDKDIAAVVGILKPLFQRCFLTRVSSSRAATPEELHPALPEALMVDDPLAALRKAREGSRTVVVTGSFYLVGEMLDRLNQEGVRL